MFDKVAIVGTGLIGGSLGLALKQKGLARSVVGVCRHRASCLRAVRGKAADRASRDIRIIAGCDLLILAVPVQSMAGVARRAAPLVGPGCIVIDVGSTKQRIVRDLGSLFKRFVGCHPMAGSEKRGVTFARPDLFCGSLCLVTPVRATERAALATVERLWKRLGSRVLRLTPAEHDRRIALVSHLPHCLAFCLIDCIPGPALRCAGPSLRETTRVAGSPGEIWTDILLDNRAHTLRAIRAFRGRLDEFAACLRRGKRARLGTLIRRAQKNRSRLP